MIPNKRTIGRAYVKPIKEKLPCATVITSAMLSTRP